MGFSTQTWLTGGPPPVYTPKPQPKRAVSKPKGRRYQKPPQPQPAPVQYRPYQEVRRGDNWFNVAQRNNISPQQLREANPTTRRVQAGQTLRVPQGLPQQAQMTQEQITGIGSTYDYVNRPAWEGPPGYYSARSTWRNQLTPQQAAENLRFPRATMSSQPQYNDYYFGEPGRYQPPPGLPIGFLPQQAYLDQQQYTYLYGSPRSPAQAANTPGYEYLSGQKVLDIPTMLDIWTLDPTQQYGSTGYGSQGGYYPYYRGYGGGGGYTPEKYGPQAAAQRRRFGRQPTGVGRNYATGLGLTNWRF